MHPFALNGSGGRIFVFDFGVSLMSEVMGLGYATGEG
jgi:hypothetical protein